MIPVLEPDQLPRGSGLRGVQNRLPSLRKLHRFSDHVRGATFPTVSTSRAAPVTGNDPSATRPARPSVHESA